MSTTDHSRASSMAALQGKLWNARARDWAELHEHLHTPLYQAAFDAMGVDQASGCWMPAAAPG